MPVVLQSERVPAGRRREQDSPEERRILNSLLSNCTPDDLTPYPTYKIPFDLLAEGLEMQKKLPERNPVHNRSPKRKGKVSWPYPLLSICLGHLYLRRIIFLLCTKFPARS